MRKICGLLLSLLMVAACSMPESQSDTIKIGAFLSLTGATSAYGISASNAIKLAADELLGWPGRGRRLRRLGA